MTEIQLREASKKIATILAIIIVLLGVLGLISLSIQKKRKEIGIRKVLGASPINIIMLFLKDFIQVVSLAFVMACPLDVIIMHKWLDGYAYKIKISFIPFLISFFLLTFITAIFIVFQTMKTSFEDPSKSINTD